MKHLKTILILSLGLNLIASFFVARRLYFKYNAYKMTVHDGLPKGTGHRESFKIQYYLNRQELFEVLPKDSNSIIFLGNSLTQNFELAELLHNMNVKNRGINSDRISGVLNRLNDLGGDISKDSVVISYFHLLDTLQKECKTTKIYVQSLFPVENDRKANPTFCNPKVNANILEVNKALLKYATQHHITFVDTYSKFESGGQLNPKYSIDGVHLTGEGYLLWAKILRPYVEE